METDRSQLYSEVIFKGFSSNPNNEMSSTTQHDHGIFHNNKRVNATELNEVTAEVRYCPALPPGLGIY